MTPGWSQCPRAVSASQGHASPVTCRAAVGDPPGSRPCPCAASDWRRLPPRSPDPAYGGICTVGSCGAPDRQALGTLLCGRWWCGSRAAAASPAREGSPPRAARGSPAGTRRALLPPPSPAPGAAVFRSEDSAGPRPRGLPFKPRAPEAVARPCRGRKWCGRRAAAGGRLGSCLARPGGPPCRGAAQARAGPARPRGCPWGAGGRAGDGGRPWTPLRSRCRR